MSLMITDEQADEAIRMAARGDVPIVHPQSSVGRAVTAAVREWVLSAPTQQERFVRRWEASHMIPIGWAQPGVMGMLLAASGGKAQ